MHIKLKKQNKDGFLRVETKGAIKEVLINEDLMSPKEETVQLCFKGDNSSGIVELSTKEIEDLYRQIRPYLHLIKRIN